MDTAHVYENVNPTINSEKYTKDFEVLAIDNLNDTFETKNYGNDGDICSYINLHVTTPGVIQILWGRLQRLIAFRLMVCSVSRHREHLNQEIRPAFSAYSASVTKLLQEQWKIPSTYFQLRTYANACGTFQKYVKYNARGDVENISLVLRVPHSPRQIKSIWSLGLCWTPKLGRICAQFDGAADADIQILRDYLNSRPRLRNHPLVLPTILMDMLGRYKIISRNLLERVLFDLEIELGVTRGRGAISHTGAWLLSDELDRVTTKCNQLTTSITYQERGQVFIKYLAERMRRELATHSGATWSSDGETQLKFKLASNEIEDILENCYDLAMNTIHQTECIGKRAQVLLNVKDSRDAMKIAAAAKRDSSIVTAIAVVTMIFLPATFVTSFFGMNHFEFDAETRALLISKSFWLFWATALPLTAVVLLVFLLWTIYSRQPRAPIYQQQSRFGASTNPRSDLLQSLDPLFEFAGPCYPPK